MRIGLMLRSIDEKGGIGVYTHNIVDELLRLDRENRYILFYRTPTHMGEFTYHDNVTERLVWGKYKPIWDQIAVPLACWRDKIDVVFHPKFTTPLLAPCKAVMVVHGADYFIPDHAQYYHPIDVLYAKTMMPVYFRKATTIISVSQITTDDFYRVLQVPSGKIQTVYVGVGRHFRRVEDQSEFNRVRTRYSIPQKFILTLTKCGKGGDRRKNFGQILQAYARYHERESAPHKLVVGGQDCHLLRDEYDIPADGYGQDILFAGWLEQQDLPAIYSMADLYLHPSNLEAFPQPVAEAMSCGTPLITSNTNGLQEIAGNAAVLVDPKDADQIANAICQVLRDVDFQKSLSERGLERSRNYSWDNCARETLAILEEASRDNK